MRSLALSSKAANSCQVEAQRDLTERPLTKRLGARRAARLACSCAVDDGGVTATAPGAPGTGMSGRCAGAVIGSGLGGGGTVDAGADSAGGGALPLMLAYLQ